MSCNFEKLVQLLDKQLDLDEKLDILYHIEHCEICHEAIYLIARDRDWNAYARPRRASSQPLPADADASPVTKAKQRQQKRMQYLRPAVSDPYAIMRRGVRRSAAR
jgi:hypothetical protein